MERVEFLQKQIELAESSWNSLARLYGIAARVAWFCAPIASYLPLFFDILYRAIIQELIFTRAISRIALSRFSLFSPPPVLIEGEPRGAGERLELENRTPLVSSMLGATLNEKMRPQAFETQIMQKPRLVKPHEGQSIAEEKPEKRRGEEPSERTPDFNLFRWQVAFTNNLSPKISNVLTRLDPRRKATVLSALYATMSAPAVFGLADVTVAPYKTVEVRRKGVLKEEANPSAVIEEPAWEAKQKVAAAIQTIAVMASIVQSMSAIPQLTTKTAKPATTTYTTLETAPRGEESFREETLPISELSSLPSVKDQSIKVQSSASLHMGGWPLSTGLLSTIAEQQKPFFEIAGTLSQYSSVPMAASIPMVEFTYGFGLSTSSLASILPTKVNLPLQEVSPALTSWIYEGSEALRSTGVPLSAVPIAASEAEKIVTETLFQPMSAQTKTLFHDREKPELGERELSRLPTALALAGAGSLIVSRLQYELVALGSKMVNATIPRKGLALAGGGVGGSGGAGLLRSIQSRGGGGNGGSTGDTPAKGLDNLATSEPSKETETGHIAIYKRPDIPYLAKSTSWDARLIALLDTETKFGARVSNGSTYRNVALQASKIGLLADNATATAEHVAKLMSDHYLKLATGTPATVLEIGEQPAQQYLARKEIQRFQRLSQTTPSGGALSAVLERGMDSAYAIVQASQTASAPTRVSRKVATTELVAGSSAKAAVGTAFGEAFPQPPQTETRTPNPLPISSRPSRFTSRPPPVSPIILEKISVVTADTEQEEDLSDLERKINKIISEQLSRYYGTSKL